jgi:DNA-binding YbaB/EbfC family protein
VQPGGPLDLQALVAQAQQMQEHMMAMQAELESAELTGSAGGGLVTATVSGSGELKALTIDPQVVDPEDTETLADLIVAAVRNANQQVQDVAAEKLGPLGGLLGGGPGGGMPGLPGFPGLPGS